MHIHQAHSDSPRRRTNPWRFLTTHYNTILFAALVIHNFTKLALWEIEELHVAVADWIELSLDMLWWVLAILMVVINLSRHGDE